MAKVRFARASRWCFAGLVAFSTIALGAALLGEWAWLDPGSVGAPVAPTTSTLLLWLSLAAWLAQRRPAGVVNRLDHIAAAGVMAVSALIGVSFFVDPAWSLDYWLFSSTATVAPVGRMAPATALALAMAAAAFAGARPPWSSRPAVRQAAALLSIAIAGIGVFVTAGYVLGTPALYGGVAVRMALLTAAAFAVLGTGLLLMIGDDEWPLNLTRLPSLEPHQAEGRRLGFGALGLLFTLAVTVVGYVYIGNEQAIVLKSAQQTIGETADAASRAVASWHRERRADANVILELLESGTSLVELLRQPHSGTVEAFPVAWVQRYQTEYGSIRIDLFDAHGVRRFAAPVGTVPPVDRTLAADLDRALRSTDVLERDFHREADGGPWYVDFLVPLRSRVPGDGSASGVLVVSTDLAPVLGSATVVQNKISASRELLLVRRHGLEVEFLTSRRFAGDAGASTRLRMADVPEAPATKAALGVEAEFEGLDYRNVPVVAATRRVAGTPWFVVAKVDREELLTPLRRRLWQIAAMFGFLVIAAVMSVAFLWNQRVRLSAVRLLEVERARAATAETLRLALQAANQGTYDLNVQTGEAQVSPEYAQLLGYDPGTFHEPNAAWIERLHPDDRERTAAAYRDYVAGNTQDYRVEFRQKTAQGQWRWLLSMGKIVERDADGRPLRMLGTHTDVHDRKLAEEAARGAQVETRRLLEEIQLSRRALLSIVEDQKEAEVALRESEAGLELRVLERTAQLEAANQELEAFSYSVSHDLRAPLRAVSGYARMLNDDYARVLDAEGQRFLAVVQDEAQRMGRLIDELLRFSRMGRQSLQKVPVDMTAMVREVCREARATLPNGRVVEMNIADLPAVEADAAVLRQVWLNLLGNALKFSARRDRTVIDVSGAITSGEAVYVVRDNGAGFDMKYADKLFGVFHRLHAQAEFEGTGVGLALVQRIVHRHGGRVWAEGQLDHGATFSFSLPCEQDGAK